MKYRRFGKTELRLPILTFGAMQVPVPEDENKAAETTRCAIQAGINHIETAQGYGTSEERLGRILKDYRREDLIITTKIGPVATRDEMWKRIETSLNRLQMTSIENLDIHGINTYAGLELTLRKGGCMEAVREAIDQKVVGHIGFSGHASCEVILATLNTGEFESVNLHYYYFFQRNLPAIRRAAELDMGILIISPSDKGGLLYRPPDKLKELAAPFTPIELNHRWLLNQPEITTLTVGCTYASEWEDHLLVGDRDGLLTPEEMAALKRWNEQYKTLGDSYCSVCGDCLPCPEKIHIPEVLRLRNLTRGFDMLEYGQYRYKMFENAGDWYPGRRASNCTECGDCLPRCPLHLEIPKLLSETHDLLWEGVDGQRRWA
ncbi:MAG: putative oxidoreductase [Candidatus Hinthialibacteria bacterium OLB16]|nr:MAG: putative oxidoreductase [Candidatus Hinthialibacteria bacterium OLB16]